MSQHTGHGLDIGLHGSWTRELTGTAQALFVEAPDEVPTQVTPGGLSVAAGLEVMSLSPLLYESWVTAIPQQSDDAHSAEQLRNLPWAYPQGVGPFQSRRWAGHLRASKLYLVIVQSQLTELNKLPPRHADV